MANLRESPFPFSSRSLFPWRWPSFRCEFLSQAVGDPYLYYSTTLSKVSSWFTILIPSSLWGVLFVPWWIVWWVTFGWFWRELSIDQEGLSIWEIRFLEIWGFSVVWWPYSISIIWVVLFWTNTNLILESFSIRSIRSSIFMFFVFLFSVFWF